MYNVSLKLHLLHFWQTLLKQVSYGHWTTSGREHHEAIADESCLERTTWSRLLFCNDAMVAIANKPWGLGSLRHGV